MRKDYGLAATLFLLYLFFSLCYINFEGRQDRENTNEPRPVSSLVSEGSPCKCRSRPSPSTTAGQAVTLQQTTCSEYSYLRGGQQKVVSFSFYEKSKNLSAHRILSGRVEGNVFLEGLAINIAALPRLYPGQLSVSGKIRKLYTVEKPIREIQFSLIHLLAQTTLQYTASRSNRSNPGVRVPVEALSRPLSSRPSHDQALRAGLHQPLPGPL